MTRPFRFSVQVGGVPKSAADYVETAKAAEDLGYEAFSVPDHLDDQLAPMVALTAVAAATTTIQLQPLVLANDYRHPAVLAKEAATLDLLSDGRFVMAIGAGWMLSDYEQAGLQHDRARLRIERLSESITVLKGLFSGDPFSFSGDHYTITDMTGTPKPVRETIPFLIAGGARKILSLAAREADIVAFNPSIPKGMIDESIAPSAMADATDEKLEIVKQAAGARFDEIELQTSVFIATITDDAMGVAGLVAPALGGTAESALHSPHVLIGSVEECIERVQSWRERWGISYISIVGQSMHDMAPVVSALAGT